MVPEGNSESSDEDNTDWSSGRNMERERLHVSGSAALERTIPMMKRPDSAPGKMDLKPAIPKPGRSGIGKGGTSVKSGSGVVSSPGESGSEETLETLLQ